MAALLCHDADVVEAALVSAVEEPPARDTELLRSLGIDLDAVPAGVRQTFSDQALDQPPQRHLHQPWQPSRRPHPPVHALLAGSIGVTPRVKQAFEPPVTTPTNTSARIEPTGCSSG